MSDKQATAQYSPRSQRSMLDEEALRKKLINCESLIAYHERSVAKLEKLKAAQLEMSVSGKGNSAILPQVLRELEGETRELAAFKAQRAQIEAEIKGLAPSPAKIAERAERQNYLAQLTIERRKKDELADAALKGLRHLLHERAELTAKITKAAEAVEFTAGEDGLDARRFDELLAALPEDLFAKSDRWAGWFLGNEEAKTYVVRDRVLVEPETLASHGVAYFGERIELSDAQARELLRENRPMATNLAPWRCAPPSIMTIEAWDAAVVSAKESGITVEEVLFWEDCERDAKIRERNPMSTVEPDCYENHGEPVTVKVKFQSEDIAHQQGEVIEITEGKWNLCDRVAAGTFARP